MKTIINAIKYWVNNRIDKMPAVLSDWNENDPKSDNYIKNRTHYFEKGKLIRKLHFDSPVDNSWDYGPSIPFIEGKDYLVICDGVDEYVLHSTYDYTLGDSNYLEAPLCFIYTDDGQGLDCDEGMEVSDLEIYEVVIKKLDKIFMPENYALSRDFTILREETEIELNNFQHNPSLYGSFSMNRKVDTVIGDYSHVEGYNCSAIGARSSASGLETVASSENQSVQGKYNKYGYEELTEDFTVVYDARGFASKSYTFDKTTGLFHLGDDKASSRINSAVGKYWSEVLVGGKEYIVYITESGKGIKYFSRSNYAHIVGNGVSDTERSNAHTLDWNGVGWFQGGLQVGGNAQDNGAKSVLLDGDAIPVPASASVGQVLSIKAVDENGKPTEWECIDMSGSGSSVPSDEHINSLINAALGVIENGTY